MSESEIVNRLTKRKFQYDFLIDHLQSQINEAKKKQSYDDVKDILTTLQENKVLESYELKNSEIVIILQNPPDYMKALKRTQGTLQVYKKDGISSVYYDDKWWNSSIKIRSEGIWSLLIEALVKYAQDHDWKIFEERINKNQNCKICGEQLITYFSSCNDSYCYEDHAYTKCYKCNK